MNRRKIRYTLPASGGAVDPAAGVPPGLPPSSAEIISVSDLTRGIRRLLESAFSQVAVRGEVSGLNRPASGHLYFTLREIGRAGEAQIRVVLWREEALRLRFHLEDGMRVIIRGRVGVYEPRGSYQLIAARVDPDGPGEIALLLERLKVRLQAEGLFAPERKRPLPFLPRRIGVVTSTSGAALQDILRSIYRRHPRAWVRVAPVRVQGEGSAEEVAAALRFMGRPEAGVDVVIVGRGGGSPEDLWTFNEERVVRAVAACGVPTISAVGHEVDFTLCDLAADVRAQTPTHAGELVVPEIQRLQSLLDERSERLGAALRRRAAQARERLSKLASSWVFRAPEDLVLRHIQKVDGLGRALEKCLYNLYSRWQYVLRAFSEKLEALNPLKVLSRGYSVVLDSRGTVVRTSRDLEAGEHVRLLLGEGTARALIEGVDHGG